MSRFSRTERQVRDYLKRKGFSAGEISETVAYLHENRFLNDTAFAEAFIQSRIRRLDGPLKIKQMLLQKGVDRALVEQLLTEHYPMELQERIVQALLQKRAGLPEVKLLRFLASRGFPRYVIIPIFKQTRP